MGRPKLNVTAKKVLITPEQWAWLERVGAARNVGASAFLRSILETAMHAETAPQAPRLAV